MKRIMSLIFAFSIIVMSTISAYAITPEELLRFPYRDEWLSFIGDTSQHIVGYDGTDYAFNEYLMGTGKAATYGAMLQALESFSGAQSRPWQTAFDSVVTAGEEYLDGQYRSARVTRDFVDRLYSNVAGYGINGRYKTLDEYGITISGDYDLNGNITEIGTFLAQNNTDWTGYLDMTDVYNYNGISFYSGSTVPPVMYLGANAVAYQNGVRLPNNNVYFLIDHNLMFTQSASRKNYNFSGYMYRYGQNLSDIKLSFLWATSFTMGQNGFYTQTGGTSAQAVLYSNGVSNGTIPDSDSASRLQQFESVIGVQLAIEEAPEIAPPSNIPYSDDDTVIINVPIDSSKEIVFISNDDYTDIYNEGDVTENDYTYNYQNTTNNSIINNYNNYYLDITINEGGSYDDSELQTKLDVIIGKLADIYNFLTFNGELTDIFSSEPVYESFYDCIDEHLPAVHDTSHIIGGVINDSDIDLSIQQELDTWIVSDSDTDTDKLIDIEHVPFDISWYEKYRVRVRGILIIGVYILMISYTITMYRRTFGLGGV